MQPFFVFIPVKYHLRTFLNELSKKVQVSAFVSKEAPYFRSEIVFTLIDTSIYSLGLRRLRFATHLQTSIPLYIRRLYKSIPRSRQVYLICFDFYHWYVLQSVQYKKEHPETKIVIYSETKRWPRFVISRLLMKLFLKILKKNRKFIDLILVYTTEGLEWWKEEAPEFRVELMPAPVDTKQFNIEPVREWCPGGILRILMNARYSSYKKHTDLLAAAAKLRIGGKQLQITLIGRAGSGQRRIEQMVKELKLSEVVTFLDPLPMSAMPNLYQRHDVLVLPSYNEAIGMVVPEAMACGIPTITSDTVGANVYVKDGETGIVFPTGDVDALANALEKCFDAQLLRRMSAAARQHIEQFSLAAIAERFISVISLDETASTTDQH